MLGKTFTSSLLIAIALAKGKNDGTSMANAYETVLCNTSDYTLKLENWNVYKSDSKRNELHVMVSLDTKNTTLSKNLEFGFCIKDNNESDEPRYDCLGLHTTTDAPSKKISWIDHDRDVRRVTESADASAILLGTMFEFEFDD